MLAKRVNGEVWKGVSVGKKGTVPGMMCEGGLVKVADGSVVCACYFRWSVLD